MNKTALINRLQKGFTLVELLVVIGILGVLAAALLATLDPLEQIKKGQDSSAKTVALELINGFNRYYATHSAFPWTSTADGGPATPCTLPTGSITSATMKGCTDILITDGELKNTFDPTKLPSYMKSSTVMDARFINNPGTAGATVNAICFVPQSKAQKNDTNLTRYNNAAAVTSGGTYQCIIQ